MDNRIQAETLVQEHITNPALLARARATQAAMRALAKRLGQDEQRWGLTGLLYGIDYEYTARTPERHGAAAADMLSMQGFDEEITHAVLAYGDTGEPRRSSMDSALYAVVPAVGLVLACADARARKGDGTGLAGLKLFAVLWRFRQPAFAMDIDRRRIDACAELGLRRREFLSIVLRAMQSVVEGLEF
jgi:predicted hydrolase (HD superfamily)